MKRTELQKLQRCQVMKIENFYTRISNNFHLKIYVLDLVVNRLQQLELLIIDNNLSSVLIQNYQLHSNNSNHSGKLLSVETLLDILLVLYDECFNSSLRREKTVTDFCELCKLISKVCFVGILIYYHSVKPVVANIKKLRLARDDFEILKVIYINNTKFFK